MYFQRPLRTEMRSSARRKEADLTALTEVWADYEKAAAAIEFETVPLAECADDDPCTPTDSCQGATCSGEESNDDHFIHDLYSL